MPKILVHKAFNLLLNSTSKLAFEPGLHDVTDDVAEHWYTKQHADVIGAAPVQVTAESDGRKALIERLVTLFRVHVETLSIEELAKMLESAEAAHAAPELNAEPVHGAEPTETEGGEQAETTESVAPVESIEPPAEQPEPVQEGGESQPDFDPALVEAMTEEELRAYITKRDGKAPHHKLGRDKLIALALAPAAGETAEPTETEGGEA